MLFQLGITIYLMYDSDDIWTEKWVNLVKTLSVFCEHSPWLVPEFWDKFAQDENTELLIKDLLKVSKKGNLLLQFA